MLRNNTQSQSFKRATWGLFGLFGLLYILPLGVRPLLIADELRYAEIPREMVVSGDWVVPRLNGLRYFEKPPLGYWLNAVSQSLLGRNAFSVRLPSALAAGASALALFVMVRRFGGGYGVGILAAAVLLTSSEVIALGNINVLDSVLSFFLNGARVAFFFAHMENRRRWRSALLALSGALCGLAFLTKGFLAFAVPIFVLVPFMIWEGRWKDLFRILWVPAAAAVLVTFPWALMIHLREPNFWPYFFFTEHLRRFFSSEIAQHPQPFWYFLPILAGGALPWTALFPAASRGLRKTALKDPLLRFALCWLLFPFLFFSASQGKLATYILPCFAPLAILLSKGLMQYLAGGRKKAFAIGTCVLALGVGMAGALLLIFQVAPLAGLSIYGPGESWKWALGAVGLMTWAGLAIYAGKAAGGAQKRLALFCAAPVLFVLAAHFIVPDRILQDKAPGSFLLSQSPQVEPDSVLITDDRLVYAVCWFYNRGNAQLICSEGEVAYGLRYADCRESMVEPDRIMNLLDRGAKTSPITLITTR